MLTCTVDKFISIEVHFAIDATHEFNIVALYTGNALNIEDTITIYRSGTAILNGVITSRRISSDGTVTYTGQDVSSFWAYNTTVQATTNEYTLTNLAAVSAQISNLISAPSAQACYGFGEFDGTIISYVERICNSFGLHYRMDPLQRGIDISAAVIEPASQKTIAPTMSWQIENRWEDAIAKVYLQKSVTVPEGEEVTVQNGSVTNQLQTELQNSIPVNSSSAYPRNVFIDPGTFQQVILYANNVFVDFSEPVAINNAVKVIIDSWSDTSAQPRWELYLYQDNTLLTHFHYTGEGSAWTASANQYCNKAVIARVNPDTQTIEYPNFAGLSCICTCYSSMPSGVQGWQQEFLSGDGGRPDTNTIDDPMFPPLAQLDGVRIAKRDSDPNSSNIEAPGIVPYDIALPVTTYTDRSGGIDVPLVQLALRDGVSFSNSSLQGIY